LQHTSANRHNSSVGDPLQEAAVSDRAATGDIVSTKAKPRRTRKGKLTLREQAFEEFHAWYIKYDDLAELLRVERQIMQIEDALSEDQVPSEEDVSQLSSAASVRDKKERGA
jgi:hypothetical protein